MRRLLAAVAVVCVASAAHPSPDLTPEIYELTVETDATVDAGDVAEGCATATEHRTLVRFGVRSYNVGDDALMLGNPGCPDCKQNPGATCRNREFVCSPAGGHNHPHFSGFAEYALIDPDGNVVARGAKRSFCLRDNSCTSGHAPTFVDCNTNQGISAGCRDEYSPRLGCQYIDLTGLALDRLPESRVRVTIDPGSRLDDADRSNNVVEVAVVRCGDGVRQTGEECDAGPAGSGCCTSECRSAPDGTSCATDVTACGKASCVAGQCVLHPAPDRCVIEGGCVAAGTTAPGDSCRRCDPTQATDAWSRIVTPDATGLRCQTNRLAADGARLRCRSRLRRAVVRRLKNAATLLDRLLAAPSARRRTKLVRRLEKLAGILDGRGAKAGCDIGTVRGEVDTLLQQLRGLPIMGTGSRPGAPPRVVRQAPSMIIPPSTAIA